MTEKQNFLEPEHDVQKRYETLLILPRWCSGRGGCGRVRLHQSVLQDALHDVQAGKVEFFREPTKFGHKSRGDSSLGLRMMELRLHGLSINDISRTLAVEGMSVSHNRV